MGDNIVNVGLINPKSPENVGAVMRAAGNFRVDNVYYTGKRYPRALMRNPALPDMHRKYGLTVSLSETESMLHCVRESMKLTAVELVEGATPLPDYQHANNEFYIFGPEDGSIEQTLIDKMDSVIYVPTFGCMNLAATVGVVLYDRLAKSGQAFDENSQISVNRDINNRLKV